MGMKHDPKAYEPQVFEHLAKILKPGDLTYDVGAYDGITSVRLAQIVGGENVVLIESGEMNWATIRAYWHSFGLHTPRLTYSGFVSDEDRLGAFPAGLMNLGGWPHEADEFPIAQYEEGLNFRNLDALHLASEIMARPWFTLDTVARFAGDPKGIIMDIEGAELLALRGAEQTLRRSHPFVWVSIHAQLLKNFCHHEDMVRKYMQWVGYEGTLLYEDQEQHWFFSPAGKE